jgi:hypothetical protein
MVVLGIDDNKVVCFQPIFSSVQALKFLPKLGAWCEPVGRQDLVQRFMKARLSTLL